MSFIRHGIGDHGPNADGTGETAPSGTANTALPGHMTEGERIPRESASVPTECPAQAGSAGHFRPFRGKHRSGT